MNSSEDLRSLPRQLETVILRQRLLKELRGIHTHKLTLVTAPPGYGKTTLVAQYIQQTNSVVAWHTIEPRERDLPNLFEHCIAAVSQIVPEVAALKFRPRSTPDEMAVQITECLRREVNTEVVYVLDDAHELLGSLASEGWLRAFIRTVPQNWHVVLISRLPPNLSLTDMVARREVFALRGEQLRFTYGEIGELAASLGVRASVAQMERIDISLAGWPAGTILAFQPLPYEIEQVMLGGKTDAETLFEMMATSLLETLALPLRHFLLASSTLAKFTPELCKKILGLHKSASYISEVETHNLFISHVQGGLIYHGLFRDVLQKQFREHSPSVFYDLHRRAGEWYEQQQAFEEAFDHYVAANQFERATVLAEASAQLYYNQGKIESVLRWARKLCSDTHPCPHLHFTCATIHTTRQQYEEASLALEQALVDFEAQQDRIGQLQVQLLQATLHNQQGEYAQAIKLTHDLMVDAAIPENLRGLGLTNLGVAHLNLGETNRGLDYLEAALPIYRTVNDTYSLSQFLQHLEVAYLRAGRFDDATLCIQEISSIQRNLGNATGLAFALNNLGYHYHMCGLYQQAQESFEEGLSIAARLSDKRAEAYLYSSMAELLRDRGAWGDALRLYQKALETNGRDEPSLRCSLLLNMSTLHRWHGQSDEALTFAQEALGLATNHHMQVTIDKAETLLFAAHIRFGELPPSAEKLNQIVSRFQERQAVPELILAWGIMAHYEVRQLHLKEADAYLRRALRDALHPANLHPLIAEIVHNDDLQRLVKQQPLTYQALLEGVKHLQSAQISSEKGSLQYDVTSTTYSLRVACLGQEQVERDGEVIDPAAWQGMLPRAIFLYLLFLGPTERETIGLQFWPDSTAHQVRDNFHTQLRRTRQAVGQDTIDFDGERYFINPRLDVWCDAFEFEKLVKKARIMSPRQRLVENWWRQAVELNKGDLLPSLDTDWILPRRETLQQMYSEAVLGLARCLQNRERWDEAIPVLKRGLERDPLREDMYRAIMLCYARQGQMQQVIRHFEELKRLLFEELALEPSSETVGLVHSLLH